MMDPSYYLRNSSALPSPALLVYPDKIRQNTALAVAIAGNPDRLWPHIKTHKRKRKCWPDGREGGPAPDASFRAIADDRRIAAELSERFSRAGGKIEVLLDIDPGMGRTGVAPDEKAVEFYLELGKLKGIVPGGLHCFDGHNNQEDPAARMSAARKYLAALHQSVRVVDASGDWADTWPVMARERKLAI